MGRFDFSVQQFYDVEQDRYPTWFDLSGQFERGYTSERLKEHSSWLSLKCSYQNVEDILERQTGGQVLSDQTIRSIVVEKAGQVSAQQTAAAERTLSKGGKPRVCTDIDLYDPKAQEIILSEDGIQVKGQKEERRSKHREQVSEKEKGRRWNTDIVSLQQADGTFRLFTDDLASSVPLSDFIRANVLDAHGQRDKALNIVAIADGARSIRCDLIAAFGTQVVYILDWYHLCKKINELLSMVAYGKQQKEALSKSLLNLCWKGEARQAIEELQKTDKVRNPVKHKELIDYLTKHREAIINYEKRRAAGKRIGSGFMESAVNEALGKRQKSKGSTWRPTGSKALAILKIAHINGDWGEIWKIAPAA